MQRGAPDPYRALGVQRAATAAQVKSAHRKLAKRYHPDAPEADTSRFLAIQEAYLLLSDPLRRREWDNRHAPGPVRAGDTVRRGTRPRAADGRWTREEGTPSGARPRPAGGGARRPAGFRPSGGSGEPQGPSGPAGTADPRSARDRQENRADPDWNASGRDPSTRSYRWSAENVPWWEDFSPRGAGEAKSNATGHRPPAGTKPRTPRPTPGAAGAGATPQSKQSDTGAKPDHGDVYSRSSGAAWSSAARQYFRRSTDELASRGAFVYRGTQVVTGAKAREAYQEASEELLRRRAGVGAAPRQAFEARSGDGYAAPSAGKGRPRTRDRGATDAREPAHPPQRSAGQANDAAFSGDIDASEEGGSGRTTGRPSLLGAAGVGAAASLVATIPLLILSSLVLNPPLQPAFGALLILLAAIAGAAGAVVWIGLRD